MSHHRLSVLLSHGWHQSGSSKYYRKGVQNIKVNRSINVIFGHCQWCLQEFVGYYSILQSKLHFAQFFSSHWTEGFTDFPNYGSSRSILCVHIKVSFKYVPKGPIGKYRLVPYIRRAFLGNLTVDHSDVVGSSPVGAAPTTIPSPLNTWLQHIAQRQLQAETENN